MYMFFLPYIHLRPYPSLAEVFALGTTVLIAITLFHSSQLGRIVRAQRNLGNRLLVNVEPPWRSSIHFGSAIMAVAILHGVDVGIWAFLLYVTGLIPSGHASIYFAASTYTTLGDLPLGPGWRDLSPIVAMSGLMTFAWTTAGMYNVLIFHHSLRDQLRENYDRKLAMRADLREELHTIKQEGEERGKAGTSAERQQEAGKSFLERWHMRREERARRRVVRDQSLREVEAKFRQERAAEKEIYQPPKDGPRI